MPLLPSYVSFEEDQGERVESWAQVLHGIQRSPGYEILTENDNLASALLQGGPVRSSMRCSSVSDKGEDTAASSPSSDSTIKPGDAVISDARHASSVLNDYGEQVTTTLAFGAVGDKRLVPSSAQQANPHEPTFPTTVPKSWIDLPKEIPIDAPYKDSFEDPSDNPFYQKHGSDHDPFVSPSSSNRNDLRLETMSLNGSKPTGSWRVGDFLPGTPTARRSLHHRHGSSNFSFVPIQPSKLGPGHLVDDLGSDVSGLVSPVPASTQSQHAQNLQTNHALRPKLSALQLPQMIPTSWTQSTPDSYSPFDMSAENDPFLEHVPRQEQLPNGYSPHRRKASTPPTPQSGNSFQRESRRVMTSIPTQDTDAIPRPSLLNKPFVGHSDTQASDRLHAQKSIRYEWVQSETRKLTASARAVATTKEKYRITRNSEDYKACLQAQVESQETWSIARLTEDRRNLTLPNGMRALKMGPYNLPSDGMAGGNGMLGYKMAFMERVCAEVVVGKEEPKIDVGELDAYSKKAIRAAVVKDVKGWTEKRRQRRETGNGAQADGAQNDGG